MEKFIKFAQILVVAAAAITVVKTVGQGVSAIKNRNTAEA